MVKRSSAIEKKFKPSEKAIAAWRKGDLWALHAACGLAPWEFSPLPVRFGAYGLPEEPRNESDLCIEQSWSKSTSPRWRWL